MADANQQSPAELQKPTGIVPAEEVVIHVIPEKFHGAALKQKVAKLPAPTPPPAAPPKFASPLAASMVKPSAPPTPPPAATPPGQLVKPQPKKGKLPFILGGIALLLILGAGLTYYFLLRKPTPAPAPPPPAAPVIVCGNARTESGEDCDDGNVADNDGCSAVCKSEPAVCGNNRQEPGEDCDDGNVTDSDGCSAACKLEPAVCGNGKIETGEECEFNPDGTTTAVDGALANCDKASCKIPTAVCGDNVCQETETFQSCAEDCQPAAPVAGGDTDRDGLTDAEENGIYGSNPLELNTDNDSFVDLNEVLNLFDPTKPNSAPLKDNPGISTYQNIKASYEIFRPTGWSPRETDETGAETIFTAQTGEFVSVSVQAIEPGESLAVWYGKLTPDVPARDYDVRATRQGYSQIVSDDGMTAYVLVGERIFVVAYGLGTQTEVQYKVTFQMMINSLKML